MRSRLYSGQLRHRREGARAYAFTYGVFYWYIDLDEIDEIDRRIRLFSYNRLNVLSFLDRDHAGRAGQGVRAAIHERLASQGIEVGAGSVAVLTNARILNYVFNPVSFYLVRDVAGALRHVIAEVHNTGGQRHLYDLPRAPESSERAYVSSAVKEFYVSPFIDMEARYEFFARERNGALELRLDEFNAHNRFFQADLRLRSAPVTNANVVKMLLRYPVVTMKTTALIHWQGLKLWLRGERYRRNPRPGGPRR